MLYILQHSKPFIEYSHWQRLLEAPYWHYQRSNGQTPFQASDGLETTKPSKFGKWRVDKSTQIWFRIIIFDLWLTRCGRWATSMPGLYICMILKRLCLWSLSCCSRMLRILVCLTCWILRAHILCAKKVSFFKYCCSDPQNGLVFYSSRSIYWNTNYEILENSKVQVRSIQVCCQEVVGGIHPVITHVGNEVLRLDCILQSWNSPTRGLYFIVPIKTWHLEAQHTHYSTTSCTNMRFHLLKTIEGPEILWYMTMKGLSYFLQTKVVRKTKNMKGHIRLQSGYIYCKFM